MEFFITFLVIFLLIYFFRKRILLWVLRKALRLPKEAFKTDRQNGQVNSQPKKSSEKVDQHEILKRHFDKDQGEYVKFTEEPADEPSGSSSKKT